MGWLMLFRALYSARRYERQLDLTEESLVNGLGGEPNGIRLG